MKTLFNKCAVAILTLTLAISASAGQIQCPGVVSGGEPTSPTNVETTSITSDITTSIILTATSLIS
ncbi:MAG TPA: hypothetical protein VKA97_00885 [Pyrinomonadaceae bacterium]|nr:hypothetical protein [Pyrinomonadaceae bacterium]